MLSLQEAVQKDEVKPQIKAVKKCLGSYGMFHPDVASVYNVPSDSLRQQLHETLDAIPLREFLAKSGTAGIAGAAYMVPDKVHDELVYHSTVTDIAPLIGRVVTGWPGGDLKVDIVSDVSYYPKTFTSGGRLPTETVQTMQATISPTSFAVHLRIGDDLVEDANFDMVEYHLQRAAQAMGEKSSELALTVLKTATDGWGSVNGAASGDADETKWTGATTTDVETDLLPALADDNWIPNTIIMTTEAWVHSVNTTLPVQAAANEVPFQRNIGLPTDGFDMKIGIPPLDLKFCNNLALHDSADGRGAAMTACVTIVFDRYNALLTGRKRWMQINEYSEPVRGLAGAVVSARQDSVTLYDDAIGVITET